MCAKAMMSVPSGRRRLRACPNDRSRPRGRLFPEADYPLQGLTGQIIEAFIHVHLTFGYGFLESVYRKTLAVELRRRGIAIEQLVRYELTYCDVPVGTYEADLVVEQSVIVEIKNRAGARSSCSSSSPELPESVASPGGPRLAFWSASGGETRGSLHVLLAGRYG